jgi:hypothetical protein
MRIVLLASKIAVDALSELKDLLKWHLPVGVLHGDADAMTRFNLPVRGTHVCLLWDRAFTEKVVYTTYESLWMFTR